MKLKLYHCPFACSGVTMNALEEAGLEYDDQLVNIGTGEQKRPEYLAVHPDGKVPALAVDDEVLTENPSILMFLHGIAPDARLLPNVGSPLARARQASDLVWCSATVHPMVRQIRMPVRLTRAACRPRGTSTCTASPPGSTSASTATTGGTVPTGRSSTCTCAGS